MKNLLLLISLSCLCISLFALDCNNTEALFKIEITPDQWPYETNWELKDGSTIIASGGSNDYETCVNANTCLQLKVTDSAADGFANPQTNGFRVYYNGELLANQPNFSDEYQLTIGCPSGLACTSAPSIQIGEHNFTADEHWYAFSPNETGMYNINTCFESNECESKIWLYQNSCATIEYTYTREGTLNFAENTCDNKAQKQVALDAAHTYYIRIGTGGQNCSTNTNWELSYLGPITGCTDTEACNFNPIATISDNALCEYENASSATCVGPDLIVGQEILQNTIMLDTLTNNDNCFIDEGCLSGYGLRKIVRFTTNIVNQGDTDFYLGDSPDNINEQSDLYTWDPCHSHWHYISYAEYLLFNNDAQALPIGFKMGFCVSDIYCPDADDYKYDCSDMGLTAGCWDQYPAAYDCQWIDVTDVSPGLYTLVVRVNWAQIPDANGNEESDYLNNWAQVCIELVGDSNGEITEMIVLDDCDPYVDCTGETYGSAQYDCEGICNGDALFGDLNNDGNTGTLDAFEYIEEGILSSNMTVDSCNDLNADGEITVTDAALLLGCIFNNQDSHDHPDGSTNIHAHCQFPNNTTNPNDVAILSLGNHNPDNHYFEILLENPDNFVLAYEFDISGIETILVERLYEEDVILNYNSSGKIVGLPIEEAFIQKSNSPTPIVRIYYNPATITANTISCINVKAVLNGNYEEVLHQTENGCLAIGQLVNNESIDKDLNLLKAEIYPIPTKDLLNIKLNYAPQEEFHVTISDLAGHTLVELTELSSLISINVDKLKSGIYMLNIGNPNSSIVRKIIIY